MIYAGLAGVLCVPVPHVGAVAGRPSLPLLRVQSWRFSYPIAASQVAGAEVAHIWLRIATFSSKAELFLVESAKV